MKYLITGGSGQVGRDIFLELDSRYGSDAEIYMPTHDMLNITNYEDVVAVIKTIKPDVIFHCAAYTNVDAAEDNKDECYKVNVLGTSSITDGAAEVGAKLIHVSTDYVFDGTNEDLYTISDKVNPINFYGETKALAEDIVRQYPKSFIARTSWVFGEHGTKNFVKTILHLANSKKSLKVVGDQFGSPTYSRHLARLLVDMAETEKYGLYHTSNEGFTSWYNFARYIVYVAGLSTNVLPVPSSEYQTRASRPLNNCLDKSSITTAGFEPLPDWQAATKEYVENYLNKSETKKRILEDRK